MKLRAWHVATAIGVSLALHAGAAGYYLSGGENTLMAGGTPSVAADLGEAFQDTLQAGTNEDGETAETKVEDVIEPVDAPEAERAVAESTALVESKSPEASDPAKAPVLETATEVLEVRPVTEGQATKAVDAPQELPEPATGDVVAVAGPELTEALSAPVAYAAAAPIEMARPMEVAEPAEVRTVETAVVAIAEPGMSEEMVEATAVEAVPTPRGRPKNLKVTDVKREAPARKDKAVKRQKEKAARARKSGGSKGAGGRARATSNAGGASQASRASEAGNADISNYDGKVRRRLERAKRRSREAGNRSGVVTVHFYLDTSGSVTSVRVIGSSGDSVLDKVAMSLVRKAAPYPPIPAGAGRKTWNFTIPIEYRR